MKTAGMSILGRVSGRPPRGRGVRGLRCLGSGGSSAGSSGAAAPEPVAPEVLRGASRASASNLADAWQLVAAESSCPPLDRFRS